MSIIQAPLEAVQGPESDHRNGAIQPGTDPESGHIVAAAIAILTQGEVLLRIITLHDYTRRIPSAFNARVGEHYRHCLDHFTSLVRGIETGLVNYDARDRDARVECDLTVAQGLTRDLCAKLGRLSVSDLNSPVLVQCAVGYGSDLSPLTHSTFLRELVYVIAHSIHHYALIATMCRLMDVEVPGSFGLAPSTVAHNARQASQ